MNIAAPIIIPAIIPESLEALDEQLVRLEDITSSFQIDIVDGRFVPYTSWPYNAHAAPELMNGHIGAFKIELDLMIEKPETALPEWLKTSAERFVVHVESTDELERCITLIKDAGRKVGIALGNATSFSLIEDRIPEIDYVQCMGIAEIGKQGSSFDERVLQRVRDIKEAYPGLEIAVDGSVNEDTIERIYEAGATRLVSGSAILDADSPIGAYNQLLRLVA